MEHQITIWEHIRAMKEENSNLLYSAHGEALQVDYQGRTEIDLRIEKLQTISKNLYDFESSCIKTLTDCDLEYVLNGKKYDLSNYRTLDVVYEHESIDISVYMFENDYTECFSNMVKALDHLFKSNVTYTIGDSYVGSDGPILTIELKDSYDIFKQVVRFSNTFDVNYLG